MSWQRTQQRARARKDGRTPPSHYNRSRGRQKPASTISPIMQMFGEAIAALAAAQQTPKVVQAAGRRVIEFGSLEKAA